MSTLKRSEKCLNLQDYFTEEKEATPPKVLKMEIEEPKDMDMDMDTDKKNYTILAKTEEKNKCYTLLGEDILVNIYANQISYFELWATYMTGLTNPSVVRKYKYLDLSRETMREMCYLIKIKLFQNKPDQGDEFIRQVNYIYTRGVLPLPCNYELFEWVDKNIQHILTQAKNNDVEMK
jgi:hypothetical protein